MYEKLHQQLVKREVLHADETTLQVLHEPGKKAQTKSYMWAYRPGRDGGPMSGGSSTGRSTPCRRISGAARRRLPGWNTAINCFPERSRSKTSPQKSGQRGV